MSIEAIVVVGRGIRVACRLRCELVLTRALHVRSRSTNTDC